MTRLCKWGLAAVKVSMWSFAAALAGLAMVALVLWDAFQTILLPRTVVGRYRLTRLFYQVNWTPWAATSRRLEAGSPREHFLSLFGPLSLLLLIGFWAGGLIVGFGLLHWATRAKHDLWPDLGTGLYLSGTTFFTLGLGDVKPETWLGRIEIVAEAGLGFGFLASLIGYLPVIYAAFARREIMILRLDVRAGSPPSAVEFLRQHGHHGDADDLDVLLLDCEQWTAEVLESQLSYPILAMYRSQHRDQSWLATLTVILDTCALLLVGVDGLESRQAAVTFAMARRAMVDLAHLFGQGRTGFHPTDPPDRLPSTERGRLRHLLEGDAALYRGPDADKKLDRLRATYEPAAHALSIFLLMPLPAWMPPPDRDDQPASDTERLFAEEGAADVSLL